MRRLPTTLTCKEGRVELQRRLASGELTLEAYNGFAGAGTELRVGDRAQGGDGHGLKVAGGRSAPVGR
jgi:hypothetical protein